MGPERWERIPSSGVYGLRVNGLPGAAEILRPADASWPEIRVERSVSVQRPAVTQRVNDREALFYLQGRVGIVELTREPLVAHLRLDREYEDAAIVHPFLAMTAAICSRWFSRDAFHAGSFEHAGGAWAVLGDKGAGKSTLLARLAERKTGIYADDVLVVEDGLAHAGPGCIDLRPDAAVRSARAVDMGVVGSRARWRIPVPPATPLAPLCGWLVPTWGCAFELVPVPAHARLPLLLRNLALRLAPRDPARMLQLAALPCWELRRPRSWQALDETVDELLPFLASRASAQPSPV